MPFVGCFPEKKTEGALRILHVFRFVSCVDSMFCAIADIVSMLVLQRVGWY